MSDKNTRESRLEARRNLIIESARICFQHQGLRGASIADIARLSKLGAGQIYRCFHNKEDIVAEIVQRIVFRRVNLMLDINHDLERLAQALSTAGSMFSSPQEDSQLLEDDEALLLEISAEAVRNPRIAEILLRADERMMQEGRTLMKTHYPWLPDDQIAARGELMAVLCDGTLLRRRIRQARGDSGDELQRLYRQLFTALFAQPVK